MVGDNIETDIKGGKAAGLFSILLTASNVEPAGDRSPADLVLHDLTALLHYLDGRP